MAEAPEHLEGFGDYGEEYCLGDGSKPAWEYFITEDDPAAFALREAAMEIDRLVCYRRTGVDVDVLPPNPNPNEPSVLGVLLSLED